MPRLAATAWSTALLVCCASVAGLPPAAAADSTPVRVSFTGTASGDSITTVTNDGTGATTQSVVTAGGGRLVAAWSRISTGIAARYPSYDGAAGGKRAVLAVSNEGSSDDLGPGANAFSFGADAKLASVSSGSASDNGNNLVQRGLAKDTAQFKLQLDASTFSCRVKGDDGALMVTSSLRIATGRWYRASCAREVGPTGDRLSLSVAPVKADGTLGTARRNTSKVSPVGALSFALDTPLSVGGKLTDTTTISSASDQWNGMIDSAFLTVTS